MDNEETMGHTWAIKKSRELTNKTQVMRMQKQQTTVATQGYKEQHIQCVCAHRYTHLCDVT